MSSVDPSRRRTETLNLKVDLGVKTKTQLMAERSVFKVLLMTVIAARAEPELQDQGQRDHSLYGQEFRLVGA